MSRITNQIIGITLGIRFSRSFRIPDMSGEIIDNILRDPESPFDTDFFPEYNETVVGEKILQNDKGDNIKITADDFILSLKVDDDFEEKFSLIGDRFIKYAEFLFEIFAIEEISRVGVLYYCNLQNPSKFNETIKSMTNDSISNVQNFSARFTRKKPAEEALLKKGVKDHINIIYSFKEKDAESVEFNYDYQKFFIPIVTKLKDTKLDKHFKDSLEALKAEYTKWINVYDAD